MSGAGGADAGVLGTSRSRAKGEMSFERLEEFLRTFEPQHRTKAAPDGCGRPGIKRQALEARPSG